MSENEKIIEFLAKHTEVLLQNHWPDITDFRNGAESIKVGFSHLITYQGQERIIESTISFGKRMKDSTIDRLDTDQLSLSLSGDEPAKKRRGRSKKTNIISAAINDEPPPAAA